ncbi:MAG: hypothetical protein AAF211_14005 [Myxococcota bacterium]
MLFAILTTSASLASPWTVTETERRLTIASPEPGVPRVDVWKGRQRGAVYFDVDLDDDGKPEARSRLGRLWHGKAVVSYLGGACTYPGFVPEFRFVEYHAPPYRPAERPVPYVRLERRADGNLRVLLDVDRDGVLEADVTTRFVLESPERATFCTKPGVGRL